MNDKPMTMTKAKTKVSISVLGDTFVDLSCYLHDPDNDNNYTTSATPSIKSPKSARPSQSRSTFQAPVSPSSAASSNVNADTKPTPNSPSSSNDSSSYAEIQVTSPPDADAASFVSQSYGGTIVPLGGDTRLNQPVQITAGGSGLNTATHLTFLIENFERLEDSSSSSKSGEAGDTTDNIDNEEEEVEDVKEEKEDDKEEDSDSTPPEISVIPVQTDQQKLTNLFTQTSTLLKSYPTNLLSLSTTPQTKLRLYGLYKQSTIGPLNTHKIPLPSTWMPAESAKYYAWKDCGRMDKMEAMLEYVDLVGKMENEVGVKVKGLLKEYLEGYHASINVDVPTTSASASSNGTGAGAGAGAGATTDAANEPALEEEGQDTSEEEASVEEEELTDVTLQSAFNESDYYGQILMQHAAKHGFKLLNCQPAKLKTAGGGTSGGVGGAGDSTSTASMKEPLPESAPSASTSKKDDSSDETPAATGHCIVLVSNDPYAGVERSFLTHLGSLETFKASHTVLHEMTNIHSLNPDFTIHHHHIHISGYYNLPGFQNGSLRKRLNLIRDKRRNRSTGTNVLTTTTSLVPQYDATEEWDGKLLQLLPLVDFLILNLMEAVNIVNLKGVNVEEYTSSHPDNAPLSPAMLFLQLAKEYKVHSPHTFVIVTIGKKGAVALHNGHIVCMVEPPVVLHSHEIVDPTGAGDAFCAGFVYAVMEWRSQRSYLDCAEIGSVLEGVNGSDGSESWVEAVKEGMRWGVTAGTACCMQKGASTVSSAEEIQYLLSQVKDDSIM